MKNMIKIQVLALLLMLLSVFSVAVDAQGRRPAENRYADSLAKAERARLAAAYGWQGGEVIDPDLNSLPEPVTLSPELRQRRYQQPRGRSLNKRVIRPRKQIYRLKPGDKIEVSVWGEEMTKDLVVQPDGSIGYVLVGELNVLGMSIRQVRRLIEQRLREYIVDPKVTVIGKSFEGNYVSIMGAVQRPGRLVVGQSDRLLDVLTKAGGLRLSGNQPGDFGGELANLSGAYLSRRGEFVPVDFSALVYSGDMTQNIFMEIGDFVYVPSASNQSIYVTGEVNSPTLVPHRGKPDLIQVIISAGGVTRSARLRHVVVVRGSLHAPKVIKVDLQAVMDGKARSMYLQPGDIVHVPATILTKVERIARQIIPFLDVIVRGDQVNDIIRGRN